MRVLVLPSTDCSTSVAGWVSTGGSGATPPSNPASVVTSKTAAAAVSSSMAPMAASATATEASPRCCTQNLTPFSSGGLVHEIWYFFLHDNTLYESVRSLRWKLESVHCGNLVPWGSGAIPRPQKHVIVAK